MALAGSSPVCSHPCPCTCGKLEGRSAVLAASAGAEVHGAAPQVVGSSASAAAALPVTQNGTISRDGVFTEELMRKHQGLASNAKRNSDAVARRLKMMSQRAHGQSPRDMPLLLGPRAGDGGANPTGAPTAPPELPGNKLPTLLASSSGTPGQGDLGFSTCLLFLNRLPICMHYTATCVSGGVTSRSTVVGGSKREPV